jgi:hypothetical protein
MARLPEEYFDRRPDVISAVRVGSHILLVFAPLFLAA